MLFNTMLKYFSNASTEVGLSYFIRVLQQVSFTIKGEGLSIAWHIFLESMVIFKLLYLLPFSIKSEGLGQNLSFLISDTVKNKI